MTTHDPIGPDNIIEQMFKEIDPNVRFVDVTPDPIGVNVSGLVSRPCSDSKRLEDEIEGLLLTYDQGGYPQPEIPKWLALIEREIAKATEAKDAEIERLAKSGRDALDWQGEWATRYKQAQDELKAKDAALERAAGAMRKAIKKCESDFSAGHERKTANLLEDALAEITPFLPL